MGIITKIEDKLGNIIEKPFKGRKAFDPLSLEISLKRLIERKKRDLLGKVVIPNSYTVTINEDTYREFEPFFDSLNASLTKSLAVWMKEKNYEPIDGFELTFRRDPLTRRLYTIDVSYSKERPPRPEKHIARPQPRNSCQEKKSDAPAGALVNKAGEKFIFNQGEIIIGRGTNCTVKVDDQTVSEKHARLYFRRGKVILEDLGSRNGTRVNNEKVKKRVLQDGDRLTFSCTELIFKTL